MRRRDFIQYAGATAAWPVAASGQQQRLPVVGWLSGRNAETDALVLGPFKQGLASQGYIDGSNTRIEFRWAESHYDRLQALAVELVQAQAAVIVTAGAILMGVRAVRAVSTSVPVV